MLSNKQRRKLNNFLSIIVILLSIFFGLVLLIYPKESIECKKSENECKIYSKNILGDYKIKKIFKISDINSFEIQEDGPSFRELNRKYFLVLLMKNGQKIQINNKVLRKERAETIYYNIISNDYYKIKGSLFKDAWALY